MAMQSARSMHDRSPLRPYEFPCPQCLEGIGHPRRVTTQGPQAIRVGLICDGCQHEWDITRTMKNGRQLFQDAVARPRHQCSFS